MTEAEVGQEKKHLRARGILRRVFRHENIILIAVLIGMIAVLGIITKGLSFSRGNISNILLQSSSRGIASTGQLFIILGGNFDISIGGTALVSAVLGSSLMTTITWQNIAGSPIPLGAGVLIILLTGLGVGVINGLFVSRLGVNSVIVTLAMWMIATGGAYQICRGNTIYELPRSLAFFGQGYIAGVPVSVIIFITVALLAYLVLGHTAYGRSVYAVGGNRVSAWLSGINVRNVTFSTFPLCGFLAALAGLVTLSRTLTSSMVSSKGLELDTIAACFIGGVGMGGGRGTVIGVVMGVMIIGVINNGMNVVGLDPSFQDLVKGAIILSAVTIDIVRKRR